MADGGLSVVVHVSMFELLRGVVNRINSETRALHIQVSSVDSLPTQHKHK